MIKVTILKEVEPIINGIPTLVPQYEFYETIADLPMEALASFIGKLLTSEDFRLWGQLCSICDEPSSEIITFHDKTLSYTLYCEHCAREKVTELMFSDLNTYLVKD